MSQIEETKKFEKDYSDDSFWDKVKNYAKKLDVKFWKKL